MMRCLSTKYQSVLVFMVLETCKYNCIINHVIFYFFFQAEDGIRDADVTGVQTCALPIYRREVEKCLKKERSIFSEYYWEWLSAASSAFFYRRGLRSILPAMKTTKRPAPSKIGRASCRERV